MMRPTQTWILFGVCLAVVLAAMALVSYTAVKLDRQGREHATREENVRLTIKLDGGEAHQSDRPGRNPRPAGIARDLARGGLSAQSLVAQW